MVLDQKEHMLYQYDSTASSTKKMHNLSLFFSGFSIEGILLALISRDIIKRNQQDIQRRRTEHT